MKIKNSTRFQILSQISLKKYDVCAEVDWRYPQFYDWLQVSPSYRLAHLIATNKLNPAELSLPSDFDKVRATYEAFGDVYQTYFGEWWFKTAQYRFGAPVNLSAKIISGVGSGQTIDSKTFDHIKSALDEYLHVDRIQQAKPSTLLIALPLSGSKNQIIQSLTKIIEEQFDDRVSKHKVTNWRLVQNKIRENTLTIAMRVFVKRCEKPDAPLYVIGNKSRFSPHNITDSSTRNRAQIADLRRNMETLTSRHLHRAYLLAENAARGKFPSLDALPEDNNRPKFDYHRQRQYFINYIIWARKYLAKYKSHKKNK